MTRCDYDAVFYRVFCVTLLAIAFTFTVILTNVFIDIDGLLSSKKDKHNSRLSDDTIRDEFTSEATDNYEVNYGENDDSYRTKRSIETQSFLFHIKNPKIKNILANRLSTLLEELDAEELADMKPKEKKILRDPSKDVEVLDDPKMSEEEKKKKNEDMLHLTMHNILLQGIIGHMDLHDVYKRVHSLMSNLNELHDKKEGPKPKTNEIKKEDPKLLTKPVEEKFFEEMLNCNELQEQIRQSTTDKDTVKKNVNKPIKASPNVVIKTVIDIASIGNDKSKENDTKISKENIKGIIELVYNGKKIKFTRPDAEIVQPLPQKNVIKPKLSKQKKVTIETTTAKVTYDYNKIPNSYMDKFIEEYFKRFPHETKVSNNEIKENYETKRLKRHLRVKYDYNKSQEKKIVKKNTGEDELYVEIETHFDNKGLKGEKKKKLIRSLIEKIQKAIHSDIDSTAKNNTKSRRRLHFRKRLQDPLERSSHVLINKYSLPIDPVVHRQLNPISKTVHMQETPPNIGTKSGEDWKKPCIGPGFLAAGKAINSAEMSEVDVDYSKVLDVNGIPQRLQLPLNTELSEETIKTNSYYDVGKMKFFIKDIDGSGFSVGFNQYVDEPPDAETMKLFTGLENVIKTYHQNYDPATEPISTTEADLNAEEKIPDNSNNDHIIERRSLNKKKHDYHSNEYKIIYEKDFMPYDDYRDIFETNKLKSKVDNNSKKHYNIKSNPLIVDENIFDKNLKPAEIFGLANLFERKKRSINVKKISNLKSKIKLNRYLNTNAMSTKRIFLNKKRSKRQINKIRIIATDLPHLSKHSDENVFVVSDENVFADRAIIKEVETSEGDHDKLEDSDVLPYQSEDVPSTYITKIFDGRSRHNPLMSKYPHIFMEEISRSREEYIPNNALLFGKLPGLNKINQNFEVDKSDDKVEVERSTNETDTSKHLKEQEIVNALIAPPPTKTNYKVTVKIVPKNQTGLNSGFKEIHTSINKRFNKNGLLYSSLVNVSEISKVIKINRSKDGALYPSDTEYKGAESFLTKKIKDQQEKMQYLLKQHAKHINEQLSRLNEEKTNLESMLDNDNITEIRYIDYDDIATKLKRLKQAGNKEESNTMEGEASKEVTTTTTLKPRDETSMSTILMTTPTHHPTQPLQSFSDKIKKNIISTIERNGNLTDQILKKIDKNTEILQIFLKKLTEKIQISTATPEKAVKFDENSFPPEWPHQGVNFNHNMVIRKNDSHISIPFVYAYQQPILTQKSNAPVASVIYHGHIHTNTIQHPKDVPTSAEKEKLKMVPKIPETNNQSRFFIDELENDYKVIQVGDVKKNRDYNMVNGNGTLS